MNALVTGASGFLGRHVVHALVGRGHQVCAVVRPAAAAADLRWPSSVRVVRADLRSPACLEDALDGADVLVHLAAVVTGSEELQFAGTAVATERLLEVMTRTRCRRVVLASSFAVYDWSACRGTLDENSPVAVPPALYERDGYTIAKWWQERITRRFAGRYDWGLTVLRPGFIWGRDHGYVAACGLPLGRVHLVVGPLSRRPLTHVENCADLFAVAATDPRAAGHTFNVVDGPGERTWRYLGTYLRGAGERAIRIPVPYRPTSALVAAAYRALFARNPKLPQILIPCRFQSRLKPLRYTNQRVRDVLGWQPPLDFEACLARTYGPIDRTLNARHPVRRRAAIDSTAELAAPPCSDHAIR
jgi:UDP-glucose 4-epimerase